MAAPAQAQVLPLLRWSRSASFLCASPRRLFSALRRPAAAARCEAGSKAMLKGMDYSELENWVQVQGFRPGQAMMLWKCLYGNNVWAHCYDELAGLNKDFRKMITEHADLKALTVKDIHTASDGTRKGQDNCLCFKSSWLCDELSVLLHWKGMGEPFHNIDNVIKASAIMVDEQGLHFSPRKVTVSTSGLVPQLKRFLQESNCSLAVSLNATTDEVRNWIMPINRKYNLNLLLGTLREELKLRKKQIVLFEYVMLSGVNDSMDDAKRLIELVQGIPCKINLISFNPHGGSQFKPTPDDKIIEFRNVLIQGGLTVFVRLSRGDDQMAACGQLGEPGDYQLPLLRVPEKFQVAL